MKCTESGEVSCDVFRLRRETFSRRRDRIERGDLCNKREVRVFAKVTKSFSPSTVFETGVSCLKVRHETEQC